MARFLINLVVTIAVTLALISAFSGKAHAGSEWTKDTQKLHNNIVSLGMPKDISIYIINRCKKEAQNPRRCIITAAFISKAESGMGQNAVGYNMFWINEGKKYKSLYANFDRWFKSYQKYWYKSDHPSAFYPPRWKVSKHNYCASEESSVSKKGCPFWLKNAIIVFNILTKI